MVAMTAGRSWGRPMVQRLIGEVNLKKWEYMMHSDSPMLWGILLFSPIGDVPFLLAGLACVRFRTIFVLTLITRVPIAFAAAAVGAEAFHLMWWQLMLIVVAFVLPLGFLYRYNLLKRGTNGLCFTNIGATA
jgi:uncharacterized membrane protein YdjX (TVP38/TMEM64 family)